MFKHRSKFDVAVACPAIFVVLFYGIELEIRSNLRAENVPAQIPYWTASEQREFDACMPRSLEVWKNQKSAEDYCLVNEEHRRWMRNHPQLAKRKQNSSMVIRCQHENAARMNGTRDEFRAAFDQCMKAGYGIANLQPETRPASPVKSSGVEKR